MDDHELIIALEHEYGSLLFCGGDETADLETAVAFVRFVESLPATRIHADDIVENTIVENPRWSARALEYVFSDSSPEQHAEIVVEFLATLTADLRANAWSSVRAQIAAESGGDHDEAREKPLLDALGDRIERPR